MKRFSNLPLIAKLGLGVIVLFFGCILCTLIFPSSGDGQAPDATAVNTQTPVISATDTPTASPEPSPTPMPKIPGLAPADITVSLEEQGFVCEDVEFHKAGDLFPTDRYYRVCNYEFQGEAVIVEIYGYELFSVDQVLVGGVGDSALLTIILGYVATLPYDGADPTAARAWVESAVALVAEGRQSKDFGGVQFEVSGTEFFKSLEIFVE